MRVASRIPGVASGTLRTGCVALCLLGTHAGLTAQRGGGFRVHRWGGEVRLEARYRDDARTSRFNRIAEVERSFRETLRLEGLASYFHPRFLEFDMMAEIGLEQLDTDVDSGREGRSVNALNVGYDLHARLLKQHPYAFDLHALRTERQTRYSFFATTEAVISEYGVQAFAREWWIPSDLRLKRYEYDGRGADINEEVRDSAILQGSRQGAGYRYQYSVGYEDIDLRTYGTQLENLDTILVGSQGFGAADRHNVSFNARYRDQTGTVDSTIANVGGSTLFTLQDNLQWETRAAWEDQESDDTTGVTTETVRADTLLRHRLYESINSEVGANWRRSRFQDGALERYGARASFRYRKRIPVGLLRAQYVPDVIVQDDKSSVSDVQVLDEPHVYTQGVQIVLSNIGVRQSTIVVTNSPPAPLVVYNTPADYVVSTVAGRTRIDIPVGSQILPSQTILVDYVHAPRPDARFRVVGQSVGLGISFHEFAVLEGTYTESKGTLLSGVDSGTLDNLRTRWLRGSINHSGASLAAEYERQDSQFLPFERVVYTASTEIPTVQNMGCDLTVNYFSTRFIGEGEKERGFSGSVHLNWTIDAATFLRVRGEYRDVELRTDSGTGFMLESDLSYQIQKTRVGLVLRFVDENFEIATDQRRFEARLNFARRF